MVMIERAVCALGLTLIGAHVALAQLTPPSEPLENPISEEKRVLGKILFWDEQLSSDDTVACGTCHIPAAGGSDPRLASHPGPDSLFGTEDDVVGSFGIVRRDTQNQAVSDPIFGNGRQVTGRSSPNILMSMYAGDMFWDGRASDTFMDPVNIGQVVVASGGGLESQAVGPILSNVEMAHEGRDWTDVANKLLAVVPLNFAARIPSDMADALSQNSSYADLFAAAFGDPTITPARIGLAIATYERTLIPDQTPWDLFMAGDQSAMTEQQIAGWTRFADDTVCDNCHVPPEFTDHQFYNIGLRPAAEDPGRQTVTSEGSDFGGFKTPTLRNVGLRKALMHVGWITDSQDAVDFYNAVSANTGHTQFTDDQSGIPTANPGNFVDYSTLSFFVPNPALQLPVIDFFDNALTDPRVATETFPFDRPLLSSEILTVMTYNVLASNWTQERADLIADIIRTQNADIVGIQEARDNQQTDLMSRLGDVYELQTFSTGSVNDPVLLKRSKFLVIENGSSEVTPDCNSQGFVNYLVLEYVASAERLLLLNNHFCSTRATFPAGQPTAVERNEAHAAAVIDTLISNRAAWNAPALVIGDLNASITTDTMRFLLRHEPLSSGATNSVDLFDSWDAAFPGTTKPAPIDWILTTGLATGVTVLDARVISDAQTALASDHEPVLATIAIDTTPVDINPVPDTPVDQTAPTVPGSLAAGTITDNSVALSWNAATDGVGISLYRIYRDGTLVGTTTQLGFTVTGLAPATSYIISVSAVDAADNESLAADVLITTAIQATTPVATGSGGGSFDWFLMLILLIVMTFGRSSRFTPKSYFVRSVVEQ